MKPSLLTLALLCFSLPGFAKNSAILKAVEDGTELAITLDSKNAPGIEGVSSYEGLVEIRDFNEDSDYDSVCYEGPIDEVKTLLNSLVESVDSSGDARGRLIRIKNQKGELTVIAQIDDESGSQPQRFSFSPCSK